MDKKIIIVFFLILVNQICFAQINKDYLTQEIKQKIEKNILIGRILENLTIEDIYSEKVNEYLPNENWKLDLEFSLIEEIFFPDKNYILYQIKNINYDLINEKEKIISTRVSSHQNMNPLDKFFLIGINKTHPIYIHYISGTFLKTEIAYAYNLNLKNPESFLPFLKLKLYNYKVHSIRFKKIKRKYLIFEGFSEILSTKIMIMVRKDNFDKIEVQEFK